MKMPRRLQPAPILPEEAMSPALDIGGDDHETAARFQNAMTFGHDGPRVMNVFYDVVHHDCIEGVGWELLRQQFSAAHCQSARASTVNGDAISIQALRLPAQLSHRLHEPAAS